jgi:hypothetical protein
VAGLFGQWRDCRSHIIYGGPARIGSSIVSGGGS